MDEHTDALDNDDLLEEDSDIDEEIDDGDMDEGDDNEAPVAGQAVPVVVDITHIVTEDESGLRIDKVASQVFADFSRVQLQGWITDGSWQTNKRTAEKTWKPHSKQSLFEQSLMHLKF